MSKRLQVLMEPQEYASFQKLAKDAGLSLGEWTREALRSFASQISPKRPEKKLKDLRKYAKYHYPIGEIDQVLAEIEKGRFG